MSWLRALRYDTANARVRASLSSERVGAEGLEPPTPSL